jgi:hypothetical protein
LPTLTAPTRGNGSILRWSARICATKPPKKARFSVRWHSIPPILPALLLRGKLLERQGKTHEAARAYGAAASVSPPLERLHPDLRPALSHALAYRDKYNQECANFLAHHLEPYYRSFPDQSLGRFRDSLDIMVGKKKRFDSRSEIYHFPRLAPIEFFDRADFPWLDAIEEATDSIRDEFIAVLSTEEGFTAVYLLSAGRAPETSSRN